MSEIHRSELLATIQQGWQDAERAIGAHPRATVAVYEAGLSAFIDGQGDLWNHPALTAKAITLDEYKLLQRYLLAMAFLAAWYHRHANKAMRDKAAHSASQLVSSVGLDADAVFRTFLDYERLWRNSLHTASIGRAQDFGCAPVLVSVVAMSAIFWSIF